MFSIDADFDMGDLERIINADTQEWFDELIAILRGQGIEFTERAREKTKEDGGFGNITWNLRSSIGYILVRNGEVLERYFPPINGGDEGSKTGEDWASYIATLLNDGSDQILLVLVAGMDYASLVAAHADVIDSSSAQFEAQVIQLLAA